jgi:exopolysaccharide production protein ExoZ
MMKLPNIQILRAVAALAVVFYHDGIETTNICISNGTACNYDFWVGGFGVPLFFIISGFIMVMTSWNSFGQTGAPLDFIKRRITRIVPLYWLITSIAVIGIIISPSMLNVPVLDPLYIAASYLFWPVTRINGLVRPIANLGWTLNLEMMFYVVFTGALFFSRVRGLILAIGLLAGMSILQTTGLFGKTGTLHSTPLNFWADPIILNFIMGMIIAVLYRRGTRINSIESWLLIAISVVGILLVGNFSGFLNALAEDNIINRVAAMIPMLCLVVAATMGPQLDASKLSWRAGLLIGDASYSLYLIHPFILRPFGKIWTKFIGTNLPEWTFTIIGIFAALAGGLILYTLVENRLTKYFTSHRNSTSTHSMSTA